MNPTSPLMAPKFMMMVPKSGRRNAPDRFVSQDGRGMEERREEDGEEADDDDEEEEEEADNDDEAKLRWPTAFLSPLRLPPRRRACL